MERALAVAAKAFRTGAYLSCYAAAFFAWLAFQTATEAADEANTASVNARAAIEYGEAASRGIESANETLSEVQADTAHIRIWCK